MKDRIAFQRICDGIQSGDITEFNFIDKIPRELFPKYGDKIINCFEYIRMGESSMCVVPKGYIDEIKCFFKKVN